METQMLCVFRNYVWCAIVCSVWVCVCTCTYPCMSTSMRVHVENRGECLLSLLFSTLIQRHPWLYEFEASLGYLRSCAHTKQNNASRQPTNKNESAAASLSVDESQCFIHPLPESSAK